MGRRVGTIAVVVAGVLASAATASASYSTSWKAMRTPSNVGFSMHAVSCRSPSYCLAVGSTNAYQPAAWFWNGSRWTTLTPPSSKAVMLGVSCPSKGRCIVVGGRKVSGTTNGTQNTATAAWSWVPSQWTTLKVPNPPSTVNALQSVTCLRLATGNCEAVGYHEGINNTTFKEFEYPLAEHWNGSKWTSQSTTGAPGGQLLGVACSTTSTCEAVGTTGAEYIDSVSGNALALKLNGTRWTSQNMPSLPSGGALASVSCYSGGCTAVGAGGGGDSGYTATETLAEVWNGSTWKLQSPLGSGDGEGDENGWFGVACASAKSCMAVGSYGYDGCCGGGPGYTLPLADTWNGSKWTLNTTPTEGSYPYPSNDVYGVSCESFTCTAVGDYTNTRGYLVPFAMRN